MINLPHFIYILSMKLFLFLVFFSLSCPIFALDATYYADSFEWKSTANGDIFSQDAFTVASCAEKLWSYGYAYSTFTGVVLKMNDRIGGCSSNQTKIDFSKWAFSLFAPLSKGVIKNLWFTWISLEENLPIRKLYSENTFSSRGVILSQKIANTYFTEDGIVVSGKVIDGGDKVIVFLQKKDSSEPVYSTDFSVINGNFSISLKFPKEAGEYDFVFLSSSQIQNNVFSVKGTKSLFLIQPTVLSYPKETVSSLKPFPKYINSKGSTPYISFGDNIWGVFRIEQDSKITTSTGQVFMPDMYWFRIGQARFYFSWSSLSTVSSLDQNPILFTSSGFIFLDKVRYNKALEDRVNLRMLKNAVIFRFKIPRGEKVEPKYYITLPNGDVLMQNFDKKYIDPENSKLLKSWINITATFPIDKWIYRLEVNNNTGLAYFNIPIYANGIWVPILKTIPDSDVGKITTNTWIVQRDILLLINRLRTSLWRSLLSTDTNLMKIAQVKAEYMAENDYVWHALKDNPNIDIWWYVQTKGLTLSPPYAENVAGKWWFSHLVLQDWLEESGGHRLTMINPKWTKIWIGYAVKNGNTYLAQVFGN